MQQSLKASYIGDQEKIRKLTAFFFWGSWVCSSERPGKSYSYTHNWPFDPQAGNIPETPVVFWTIIGSLGLVIGLGIVLFYHGRLEKLDDRTFLDNSGPLIKNVLKLLSRRSRNVPPTSFFTPRSLFFCFRLWPE